MSAFSSDYYRINTRETYAYSGPTYWNERTQKYKYNDVVIIDAFQQDGNYVFVRVANVHPECWIPYDYVTPMTPEEVEKYLTEGNLSTGYPWAHFNPQLARQPFYTILYWITVLMAICSFIFFILLFRKAQSRGTIGRHIVYGVYCMGLWLWVFHFGSCQWVQIGVLWATLMYPFSFTKLLEEKILSGVLNSIVGIACLVTSWMFLREWEGTAMNVGFFSWLLCILLTFVNVGITFSLKIESNFKNA